MQAADVQRKAIETIDDLESLRLAIGGNPLVGGNGERVDFGYIGTMGSIPERLADLWTKGSRPDFTFDKARHIGAGWIGPYVTDDVVEHLAHRDKDRFGRELKYIRTRFVRSSDHQEVCVRIQSAGADGAFDTPDDLFFDILETQLFSTVTGKVIRNRRPAEAVSVILSVPRQGIPFEITTTTDSSGRYAFPDVPFGLRSIATGDAKSHRVISINVHSPTTNVADIVLQGTGE